MIKVMSFITTGEMQEWLNQQDGLVYDSIKFKCDSVDNSSSGVIFTAIIRVEPE